MPQTGNEYKPKKKVAPPKAPIVVRAGSVKRPTPVQSVVTAVRPSVGSRVSPTQGAFANAIVTGDNERRIWISPTGTKVRIAPNSSFYPGPTPKPKTRLQRIFDVLDGGSAGNNGPSGLLGVRG